MSLTANLKSFVHQNILLMLWALARMSISKMSVEPLSANSVLVPADPITFIGSRGDAAMLQAVIAKLRKANRISQCYVATTNRSADELAQSMGMRSFRVWGGPLMPLRFSRFLAGNRPTLGFVTGADIMDGHYSPVMSLRMIIAADLLARWGAKTIFVGFSLNKKPSRLVRYAFRKLHHDVRVNLRDPLSWSRFEALSARPGHLVADSAFLLEPATELSKLAATAASWMQQRRDAGRQVVILNLHPMLFSAGKVSAAMPKLMASMLRTMAALTEKHGLSWLLLPHDNRPSSGDMTTLAALAEKIDASLRDQVFLVEEPPSAAEIKAIAKHADGAVTGRMHLAIAALGQTTPVMAFAYQDKFAGLLQHFQMPEWLVLDAESATDPDYLIARVERFVTQLPALRAEVEMHLPAVTAAANATFDGLFHE